MADDADSKSVGCTPVRVQVPPPALVIKPRILYFTGFAVFLFSKTLITLDYFLKTIIFHFYNIIS